MGVGPPWEGLPLPEVGMRMDWEGWRRQLWGGGHLVPWGEPRAL